MEKLVGKALNKGEHCEVRESEIWRRGRKEEKVAEGKGMTLVFFGILRLLRQVKFPLWVSKPKDPGGVFGRSV